jgi:hypothetical protein
MLITVTGRKSGRLISTPVNYVQLGNKLMVTSLRGRTWWRNLMGGAPVQAVLRGQHRMGTAHAIANINVSVAQALSAFLAEQPSCISWLTCECAAARPQRKASHQRGPKFS